MNTIKMLSSIFTVILFAVLVGCSDQLVSSSGEPSVKHDQKQNWETADQHSQPLYHAQIRIKPNRSYTFSAANTGLSRFSSIDVTNLTAQGSGPIDSECGDIFIYSGVATDKKGSEIGCHAKKLNERQITILNEGSSFVDLDVVLYGTRVVPDPNGWE